MDNLSALIYTNENALPIAKHCLLNFNKHAENLNIKKYLVSNKFYNKAEFENLDFSLIDCNISIQPDASQFSSVMLYALKQIKSKYIFWLLEDYWIFTNIKQNIIFNLIEIMENRGIDHMSLLSYSYDWPSIEIDYLKYNFDDNCLMEIDKSFYYMFSVQPSIWNRESLIYLLEHNKNLSLRQMDTTDIYNIKGERRYECSHDFWKTSQDFWDYNFTSACLRRSYLTSNFSFDERSDVGDYFCFLYSETIRGGKFNFHTHNNNRIFLKKYLAHNNITQNSPMYSKFF